MRWAAQGKHTVLMTISWITMPCQPAGMSFWGCKSCSRHKFPQGLSTTCCSSSPGRMYEAHVKSEGWSTTCCLTVTPGGEQRSQKKSHKKGVWRWEDDSKSHVKVIGSGWTPGKHGSTIYTAHFHNQTYTPKHKYTHVCTWTIQVYNKTATIWGQLSLSLLKVTYHWGEPRSWLLEKALCKLWPIRPQQETRYWCIVWEPSWYN